MDNDSRDGSKDEIITTYYSRLRKREEKAVCILYSAVLTYEPGPETPTENVLTPLGSKRGARLLVSGMKERHEDR